MGWGNWKKWDTMLERYEGLFTPVLVLIVIFLTMTDTGDKVMDVLIRMGIDKDRRLSIKSSWQEVNFVPDNKNICELHVTCWGCKEMSYIYIPKKLMLEHDKYEEECQAHAIGSGFRIDFVIKWLEELYKWRCGHCGMGSLWE